MQNISAFWLYPIILIAGALQAWGPPMNNALRNSLENPWLASLISFLPIVALLACILMCIPHPLPSGKGLAEMPWRAPLGGLVGAFAVIAGLLFVGKGGAGAFAGLTITANILMSLAVDRFGMFGMEVHEPRTDPERSRRYGSRIEEVDQKARVQALSAQGPELRPARILISKCPATGRPSP